MMQDPFAPPTNGFGTIEAPALPRKPLKRTKRYTNDEILKMVDQHETDVQLLRDRMEADYERYRLTEFIPIDEVTQDPLEGYASYTSSDPRAFANKVMSWLSQARNLTRVKHTNDRMHDAKADNLKEHLAVGLLNAADERLGRMLHPRLQGALAFYVSIRGGFVGGRSLLVKRDDDTTYVDITPWDPMNTHFSVGTDGLDWACYKIRKTRQQIQNEYGVTLADQPRAIDGTTDAEFEGVYVYDFYDMETNRVITSDQTLKAATPHGAARVPVFMTLVGNTPMIQPMGTTGVMADIGESIYESVRTVYDKYNNIMSIFLELTARARKQAILVYSRDGKKVLPEDPYTAGTEISLSSDEKIEVLKMLEMAKNTNEFMQLISGEAQRATIPYSAYGQLAFQLSGYAINSLRQGIETVLTTRLEAMRQIYFQIVNLLYDQYRSGFFDPMELSGLAQGRKYFSQTIDPATLEGSCNYTVDLVAQLPQDDMSKWTIAQMARQGPVPILADSQIRDDILGIQDSEEAASRVKGQIAETELPEARVYSLMVAAEEQGSSELASFYYSKLRELLAARLSALPAGAGGAAPGGGAPPSDIPGASPQVRPQAAMGTPPSPLTSNGGPSRIAPETPRPGA